MTNTTKDLQMIAPALGLAQYVFPQLGKSQDKT